MLDPALGPPGKTGLAGVFHPFRRPEPGLAAGKGAPVGADGPLGRGPCRLRRLSGPSGPRAVAEHLGPAADGAVPVGRGGWGPHVRLDPHAPGPAVESGGPGSPVRRQCLCPGGPGLGHRPCDRPSGHPGPRGRDPGSDPVRRTGGYPAGRPRRRHTRSPAGLPGPVTGFRPELRPGPGCGPGDGRQDLPTLDATVMAGSPAAPAGKLRGQLRCGAGNLSLAAGFPPGGNPANAGLRRAVSCSFRR